MAIYHLSAKLLSRSAGRSAVAAAAYRAGARLQDARAGRVHDYRRKAGVVHTDILLPEGAPEAWRDRATLWNAVEAGERRRDAQLAREVELALPRELSQGEAIRLAEDFVSTEFVRRGMVADLAVHCPRGRDGEAQPHAHVLLTLRRAGPDGFGAKAREWNETALLRHWRERWAGLVNARLAEAGHDVRVDHRSHAARGLALLPQPKIGAAALRIAAGRAPGPPGAEQPVPELLDAGQPAPRHSIPERVARHQAVAQENGEKIIASPALALAAITRQQATFTRRDLARFLHGHTLDAAQFQTALARVEAAPELVRLGRDGRGAVRWTTRAMLALEQALAQAAVGLAGRRSHPALSPEPVRALAAAAGLGEEQERALAHITGAESLAAVVGHAGTGKSTLLGVARRVWEAAGYQVRGAALSGIAAEGLQQGAGIASRTIAALLHQWGRGRERLTARDVLVVDEAGMVGTEQMAALVAAVRAAGAKLVLVGDPEQLQPIAAGAPFRVLAERIGAASIATVRRQRAAWQRQATQELATGRTAEALARYQAAGMVRGHQRLEDARAALVAGWAAARAARPAATHIILAHRRADVRDLNAGARAVRRRAGELGPDVALPTTEGTRPFAAGDRLYFLRNERSLGVKNGTLGTLLRIDGAGPGARLTVRLDDGREVAFDLKDYADIGHGYAATVHRSQGVTVDEAHILASRAMDRHLAYVALSRHRDRLSLHWSAEEMGTEAALSAALSRERRNDSALDYGEADTPVTTADACFAVRRGLTPDSGIVVPGVRPASPSPRQPMARTHPAASAATQPRAASASVPEAGTHPTAVAVAVSRHCAAIADSARARKALAAVWRGSEADEADLARLVTQAWHAARAIAADPALLAALRGQDPGLAGLVEALARTSIDTLIARARPQMRPPRIEQEPPAAGMPLKTR